MAMWSGANPAIWMARYSASVLKEKYAFFAPGIELSKTTGTTVISFPQFEGENNLEPEGFQMVGVGMRLTVSFFIVDADTDMSLGSPGSITEVSEQVIHLIGDKPVGALDGMVGGKLQDEFRLYISDFLGNNTKYYATLLEELSISKTSEEPVKGRGTARFLWGINPLA